MEMMITILRSLLLLIAAILFFVLFVFSGCGQQNEIMEDQYYYDSIDEECECRTMYVEPTSGEIVTAQERFAERLARIERKLKDH